MARKSGHRDGVSLAKGPVGLLGLAMIAWGVIHFLMGGNSFTASPPSGTVNGDTFLGLEGNGWTNLLWVAAGLLLAFGAPLHWAAKSMALIVGLVLGAASVISMVDGDDVFGIFAANGLTQLAWGAAAVALLLLALLPKVGRKRKAEHVDDHHRHHREGEPVAGGRGGRHRKDPVERDAYERGYRDAEREHTGGGAREPLGYSDSDRVNDRGGRLDNESERTRR
jgi:hypothetical protein